jgi:asparagine synthase (glutamine-hydrolysing)
MRVISPIGLMTRMLGTIRHRGPDESGIFVDNGVVLGHVRLSIIDLSTGQQPMASADNSLFIVFNGEIFNYVELKHDLIALGHTFKTTSDTEVLIHMYQQYGKDCLHKLNGQFVFAIWDVNKQELFIARDRVGIRPFFYTQTSNSFIFASEIKAILEHPDVKSELDLKSLNQVFTFWTTLTPNTAFKNIYELSPGHFMVLNKKGITTQCWWKLNFSLPGQYVTNKLDEAIEGFDALFSDATKIRLRADVPVAAYLSGGLDSAITTSYIKKIVPDALQTFSIGFADKDFDETSFQQEVSKYLNTRHTAFVCNSNDIAEAFQRVVWHSEIPLMRTSPAPMYLLSKKVRENNIIVVVTGEGADEMLGGYDIFKEMIIRKFWAQQPNSKLRPLLLQKLYPYIPQISKMNAPMLKFAFGYKLTETDNPYYSHLMRWNNTGLCRKYFTSDVQKATDGYNPVDDVSPLIPDGFNRWDDLSKAQWLESNLFMSAYLLSSQGDRVAMGNSIEGRYPFLDYRVIEFCSKLPPTFKTHGLTEKYLLKKLMQNKLPESVLKRPKQAYRAPIFSSFMADNAPAYIGEALSPDRIKQVGIFNPDMVAQLIQKVKGTQSGSEIEAMALTGILSTQMFVQQFIEKKHNFSHDTQLQPRIVTRKSTVFI